MARNRKRGVLLEVGAGEGQLTIPLARLLPRYRFILVDSFRGSYSTQKRAVMSAISKAGLKGRVEVNVGDYLRWLSREVSGAYDAVISSEFLPEIDSDGLSRFARECFRIARAGCPTIHSFLSPIPRNKRQRLMIEADSNPKWTKTPPKEWFSPRPSLVVARLRRAGFRHLRVQRIKSNLVIRGEAVKNFIHVWEIKRSFWEVHKSRLQRSGLEVPDWIIVSGRKPLRMIQKCSVQA